MEIRPTDDLAAKLARDLDENFDELVLAFQQQLFVFALRMSNNPQDAEEVVQDTLTRAYRALAELEAERVRSMALRAWLYQICLNQTRNRHRRRRVETSELPDELPSRDEADPTAAAYERTEGDQEIRSSLTLLSGPHRTAIVLRFVNQLSYPEISAILGQPEGTVKSNVHRGLRQLRSLLGSSVTAPVGAMAIGQGSSQQRLMGVESQ